VSAELLDDLRKTTRQALEAGTGDVAVQLDLAGLLVDSDSGGLGMGDREMALVSTEIGRAVSPSALLPTAVLAATLLAHAETDPAAKLLVALAAGEIRCAVAVSDAEGRWASPAPGIAAAPTAGDGWLLSGTAWGVSTPSQPDTVLTSAATSDGAALFAVAAEHVTLTPADQLDPARGLIEAAFSHSPARLLALPAAATKGIAAAYRRGVLAVAAEQLGVARACLETAVEYAKTRRQFGSPIGSFQAIKHRCAEVLLDVELADAVVEQAIQTGVPVDAELAFVVATRAAVSAAESCIHIHGGIGFTWEHSAHRYLRRARVNATLMGSADARRNAVAGLADLTTS